MPGRPPKPTALHVIQGTARPARMAKRAGECVPDAKMPEPPDWMPAEALVEWGRLTGETQYRKAICGLDRGMLTVWCVTWAKFAETVKEGGEIKPTMLIALANIGAKLGLNPADRVKLRIPEEPKTRSAWQNLKATASER